MYRFYKETFVLDADLRYDYASAPMTGNLAAWLIDSALANGGGQRAALRHGLAMLNLAPYWQEVALGGAIIAAVIYDRASLRK